MTGNEELTQPNYKEEWVVVAGREKFHLDEKQIEILRKADLAGNRGIVWFEKFAISIPHIESIYRVSRRTKDQLEAYYGKMR